MSVLFALLLLFPRARWRWRGQVSRLLSRRSPRHANVIDGANFALEVAAVCVSQLCM